MKQPDENLPQDFSLPQPSDLPSDAAQPQERMIFKRIAEELSVGVSQVERTAALIDSGNTIPFIARYRKEVTGSLDDRVLRGLYEKLLSYRALAVRKEDVRRLIALQGFLTPELEKAIEQCGTVAETEDIYRPFRPKRRTRAMIAREKGLVPFAQKIFECRAGENEMTALAETFLSPEKGVTSVEEVFSGAGDIIAEAISEDAVVRKKLRAVFFNTGIVEVKAKDKKDSVYEMYYDYREPVSRIAGHRVLAINRGEREEILSVRLSIDADFAIRLLADHVCQGRLSPNPNFFSGPKIPSDSVFCRKLLFASCADAWKRLIAPSLENEVRGILTAQAEEKAIQIFSSNLKSTLMQPPVKDKTVLGFDPAFRTGCKLAVVESTGKCLATTVIYPTPPQSKEAESARVLAALVRQFGIDLIAIGNGTASRESEAFVVRTIREHSLSVKYCMVNEAGASVYSASELGSEEFPDFDVSLRSAVSIARRLQDPLAELVKIDPQSIGVGQYQHDMDQKKLKESLGAVVEDCVNAVGVDLNTASSSLLSYVAGIGPSAARNIVAFRDRNGAFSSRVQLLSIPKLGEKTYQQCAGFLRIPGAREILDTTSVHPETYGAAKSLMRLLGDPAPGDVKACAQTKDLDALAGALKIGVLTLTDILDAIAKPGRDPREDAPAANFSNDVKDIGDLRENMVLDGVVRNVSTFGAFVDIGVHQDGLVHVSQLSDAYVKNPTDFVKAGQAVKVRVLSVDLDKKRISLSMKALAEGN